MWSTLHIFLFFIFLAQSALVQFIQSSLQNWPPEDTCTHDSCQYSCTQRNQGHKGRRASSRDSSWLRIVNNNENNRCQVLLKGGFRFAAHWKIVKRELTQLSSLVAHIFLAFTKTISLFDLHLFPRTVASWTNNVLWQNPIETKNI